LDKTGAITPDSRCRAPGIQLYLGRKRQKHTCNAQAIPAIAKNGARKPLSWWTVSRLCT